MKSLCERQNEIRKQVVDTMLNSIEPVINYENREIIIKTDSSEFPYIRLSISAMTEEVGNEKIIELCDKSKFLTEKRMRRFIYKMMKEAQ